MKADKWLEVNLVGLVILGGLMFVTTKIMNLNAALGQIQASVAANSARLDHLSVALPGIARDVAEEQISRPLRTLVLVSTPSHSAGRDQVTVSIIDLQGGRKWTAPLALATGNRAAALAMLAWRGYQLDEGFASLARMARYAQAAAFDGSPPPAVDATASFVLGSTSARDYLAAIGPVGLTAHPSAFTLQLVSWKDVAPALRSHPEAFLSGEESLAPRARPPLASPQGAPRRIQ